VIPALKENRVFKARKERLVRREKSVPKALKENRDHKVLREPMVKTAKREIKATQG
jgi:hypothetical protein